MDNRILFEITWAMKGLQNEFNEHDTLGEPVRPNMDKECATPQVWRGSVSPQVIITKNKLLLTVNICLHLTSLTCVNSHLQANRSVEVKMATHQKQSQCFVLVSKIYMDQYGAKSSLLKTTYKLLCFFKSWFVLTHSNDRSSDEKLIGRVLTEEF